LSERDSMDDVTIFDKGSTLRRPPCNYEAERALLGAILMNNRSMERVGEFLRPEHFADPVHGMIYEVCYTLITQQRPADPITLKTHLEGSALMEDAGGVKYLASLAASSVTVINAGDYGRLIYDLAQRREIIMLGEDMVNGAFDAEESANVAEMMDKFETRMLKLTGVSATEKGLVPFRDVLQATYAQWERESKGAQGLPTGFLDVDKLLGGLHPTDLIIVAGRPSMGKTAWAVNIAFNAALFFRASQDLEYRGKQVAFFSMEMSSEQLGGRVITGKTKIVAPRNRWGQEMSENEWATALEMASSHGDLPFWVDDTADQTVARMRARCVRLHRKKPLGLIVIDYIQLMEGSAKNNNAGRVEVVSQITRGLKKMAKELQVPVIALSQLSRAVEGRDNKRPILADLRESGSIEQDADIVIFPFRPEYYLSQDAKSVRKTTETNETYISRVAQSAAALEGCRGLCEIIVAKQRHGPLGSANIRFDNKRTWFDDVDNGGPEPAREDMLI